MPVASIAFYDVVLFVHLIAAIAGLGVIFLYPLIIRTLRDAGPAHLSAFTGLMARIGMTVITPAFLVIFATGIYMTIDRWDFGEGWINVGMLAVIVLVAMGPLFYAKTEERLAESLAADAERGDEVGPESRELLGRLGKGLRFGQSLVVVVVFLMATKAF